MMEMVKELVMKQNGLEQRLDVITACSSSTESSPTPHIGPIFVTPQQSADEYDGIFTSPLSKEICNFPLPPKHKAPMFEMFSGEQDPK